MDDLSQDRLKALQDRSQADLIQFLHTHLDLSFTMLQTARIEAAYDPQEVAGLLVKIRDAMRSIRSLTARVQDRVAWAKLDSRTDELQASMAEFAAFRQKPADTN